jgi:hypothetical protein
MTTETMGSKMSIRYLLGRERRVVLNAAIIFYVSVVESEGPNGRLGRISIHSVVVRVLLELRYRRVPVRLSN